jgi:hypothetical protein
MGLIFLSSCAVIEPESARVYSCSAWCAMEFFYTRICDNPGVR